MTEMECALFRWEGEGGATAPPSPPLQPCMNGKTLLGPAGRGRRGYVRELGLTRLVQHEEIGL